MFFNSSQQQVHSKKQQKANPNELTVDFSDSLVISEQNVYSYKKNLFPRVY